MGNAATKTCLDQAEHRAEQVAVVSLSVSFGVSAFALIASTFWVAVSKKCMKANDVRQPLNADGVLCFGRNPS